VGLLVAGGGLALSTIMPVYLLIAVAIGFSGIGIAAFHPEAARFVNIVAGGRKATAMSVFSLGGNLGFAVGPLLGTALMLAFGLQGGLFLMVPGAVVAYLMTRQIPRLVLRGQAAAARAAGSRALPADAWGPFLRLTCVILSRSIVFYGLNTFLPLYWRDALNQPIAVGGVALTILLTTGAAGTMLGGWIADRYGRRAVVLAGLGAASPILFALVSTQDAVLATILLVPLGLALFAPMSVMVVMGQEYLPNRIGTASGVTMGLGVGVGGLAAPFLGQLADANGIHSVLHLLAFIPLFSFACALTLPGRKRAAA
jgi:FSR family fosmidomycin resistance protein-like MFS transporter